MKAAAFISGRIKFNSRTASVSIALSFAVIIIAIAIAQGYREKIYSSLSSMTGDILVTTVSMMDSVEPVQNCSTHVSRICGVDGVESACAVLYSAGIVKNGDDIHGVSFKSSPDVQEQLSISIPRKLASLLEISEGDSVLSYFVSDRLSIRKFTVESVYDGIVTDDDKLVVYCNEDMLRRVLAMEEDQASAIEVRVRENANLEQVCTAISEMLYECGDEDETPLMATSVRRRYSQIFDWLGLVDTNVSVILVLMIIVGGFNMVCSLLILLFQNIRTIGILKTMGMGYGSISMAFILSSARLIGKAMLWGNAAAFALCCIQITFHTIKLDAESYFIDYVPMALNIPYILVSELIAFAAIVLVLWLPCRFISKVDPSRSVRYL